MIKVQAFKGSPQQVQPGREDYLFESKPKGNWAPAAFLAVLTGFAVYLKSFLSGAAELPAREERERNKKDEDGSATQVSEEEGLEAPLADEAKKRAGTDADDAAPRQLRRIGSPQAVMDEASGIYLPPLSSSDQPKAELARLDRGPAANDNRLELKPFSSGEGDEAPKVKGGGGGGSREEDGAPVRLAGRNRPPRTNGPVNLPDLVGLHAYFIPMLALLAGASDAEGDQMKVVALSASSGSLVQVDGGWIFTPDRESLGGVVFRYGITDGTGAVQQRAHLRVLDTPPIVGTAGDDNVLGTMAGDVIDARDGHDNIDARKGDDVIIAGSGDDHVVAGDGNDIVFAGAGNDVVLAGAGDDIVYGGDGDDRLFGEDGNDTISGEQGDDLLSGGAGDDVLLAGAGNDTVHGDAGDDTLDGGAGDDILYAGDGNDTIFADSGDDRVFGDEGNDILSDGMGRDAVYGGAGDDHISAAADGASDAYDGGSGQDTLDYSSAILDIFVDVGSGTAEGAEIGRDFIAGFERIIGGRGDDHFVGGSGPISMGGGDGADTFEFRRSDDDHRPDMVRKITDFSHGDRIIAARYEIFYRSKDGLEEGISDLFDDIYLSENSDHRPIRFRFEKVENADVTYVEIQDQHNPGEVYSIELAGRHDLEFTLIVS